jgi:hypothetical protein
MKASHLSLALVLILPATTWAQKANPTADDKWTSLTNSLSATSKVKVSVGSDRSNLSDSKIKIAQQADSSRQTALDAKTFYTQYPTHPKAEEAKKIEVLAELKGVKETDATQEKKAADLAKAFRADLSHPVSARTEVALVADQLALSRKIKAKTVADRPAEKEKLADAIRTELGQTPELHNYYVQVAKSADMFTAKRIATNLNQWSTNQAVRAEAQLIVDRSALLGQKLNLKLTTAELGAVDFSQPMGGTTVLCLWSSTSGQNMLKSLEKFQNSIPPGVRFVYVAMGGDAKQVAAMTAQAPIKGLSAHLPANTFGPLERTLKIKTVPYLFVLNREGALVGFGPVSELVNLLSLAR